MKFSATIKQLREETGASQQDVADAMGIARATYASLEADRRPPNLDEIHKLSRYFDISPMSLVLGKTNSSGDSEVNEPVALYKSARSGQEADFEGVELKFSPEKLRAVLLYVTEEVGAKPNFGEAVLHKLLYFIDFGYYEKTGQAITGLSYICKYNGPAPAHDFINIVEMMIKADELEVVETRFFKNNQKKYFPRISASFDSLSARELKHIDETLARLGNKTATELSELSRRDT